MLCHAQRLLRVTGCSYLYDRFHQPSVERTKVNLIGQIRNQMTPIGDYLQKNILPPDRGEARKINYKVASYTIVDNLLYRRSMTLALGMCYYRRSKVDNEGSSRWFMCIRLGRESYGLQNPEARIFFGLLFVKMQWIMCKSVTNVKFMKIYLDSLHQRPNLFCYVGH